jgi:hypothetical protein
MLGIALALAGDTGTAEDLVQEAFIPEEALAELTAIYTGGELDQLAGLTSYAGWRTGIGHEGNWLYFLAGD